MEQTTHTGMPSKLSWGCRRKRSKRRKWNAEICETLKSGELD